MNMNIPDLKGISKWTGATWLGISAVCYASYLIYDSYIASSDNLLPALTEEETEEMLDDLTTTIQGQIKKFMGAVGNIKQQIAEQSGKVHEDKEILEYFIKPHAITAFKEAENAIHAKYDIAPYELEEAVAEYTVTNKNIADKAGQIRMMLTMLGIPMEGGGEAGEMAAAMGGATTTAVAAAAGGAASTDHISDTDIKKVFREIVLVCIEKTKQFAEEWVQQGRDRNLSNQLELQSFQMILQDRHTAAQSERLQQHGLTDAQFQSRIEKLAQDPELHTSLMQLQTGVQAAVTSAGIHLPMQPGM